MIIPNQAIDLIKKWEGFRSEPYYCSAGVLTIGWGTTNFPKNTKTISEEKATLYLERDLRAFYQAVVESVFVPINENQLSALISFTYNVGPAAFKRSTLLKRLNDREYLKAADQFLKWNKANGRVLRGLTNRRRDERRLFLNQP